MGPDLGPGQEPGSWAKMMANMACRDFTMASPPPPPAKELPTPPTSRDGPRPGSAPSEPPNRPLPPRPASKMDASLSRPTTAAPAVPATASEAPSRPPPSRPPPLRPQAPLSMNPPTRPGTAATPASAPTSTPPPRFPGSTKRLSWTSISSIRKPKYGQGKYSHIELVPQPSNDPDDPLNWPTWRKELNYASLLLVVAMTGVMKTIFMTVNAQMAEGFQVSYTAVAALTGVPLILSSATGLLSLVCSRIFGKRPVYLASFLLVFIGAVWNTNVATSYGQCMAARIFQGLGWGAFDTLVIGSIQDTFFEHERGLRTAIHSIVAVSTTWGPPLLGGVAAQSPAGFGLQFSILSAFFALAIPAIIFGAPETAFDRAWTPAQTPATAASKYQPSLPVAPRRTFSIEAFMAYAAKMKPRSYSGATDSSTLLQAPRAFIAPTTALLFFVSFLPHATLWGLTASLSLLFHPLPFVQSPSNIGALMTAPWLLATGTAAAFALLPRWHNRFTPRAHMCAVAGGSALAFVGILTFGLHIDASMTRPDGDDGTTTVFALEYLGARVNFPAVSFVLGLLAAGVYVLDATSAPLVRVSTMFTSSNLGVATRNTADMGAGVACWRTLFAGIFVLALPDAIWAWDALRAQCIGLAIAQTVVGALVGTVWWLWGEEIRRWDGRIMKLVDLSMLKRAGSFFDTD